MITEITNIVRRVLESQVEVTPSSNLRDELGFDSMGLAVLTVEIEEAFGVDIFADDEMPVTIQDILDKLSK